jgi:hypothetical protein
MRPISASGIPQNRNLAAVSYNNFHDDTYASDTYPGSGPVGFNPSVLSTFHGTNDVPAALVVGIVFDGEGRLLAGSIKVDQLAGTAKVELVLSDPDTLATLATFEDLPSQPATMGHFRPAGAYFYQDNLDRTVIGSGCDRSLGLHGDQLPQRRDRV